MEQLEVGSKIWLRWGTDYCAARIAAVMEGRHLVVMDWRGSKVMTLDELRERDFIILPPRASLWSRIFGCKHPFARLAVEKEQTVSRIDEDFLQIEDHFVCRKCGEVLTLTHAKLTGEMTR